MRIFFLLILLGGCATYTDTNTISYSVYVDSISSTNEKPSFNIVSGMKDIENTDLRFQQYSKIVSDALKESGFVGKDIITVKLSYSISDPRSHSEVYSRPDYGYNFQSQKWGNKGNVTKSYERTTYLRKVSLKGYKGDKQLWSTEFESEGSSNNLNHVFPYIISAGIGVFGTNQDKRLVSVEETNEVLRFLRQPASK